ncbi:MAG: glutamate 5-kinase [Alphaproteobacteria bacterium]|nr:MAG: glutamate 5-kinase [Alphaproteobacteria bacterium]
MNEQAHTDRITSLTRAKRVIVKIGSALLVDRTTGRINESWLTSLAEDIARLHARGQEVAIVSSGAIALGRRALGLKAGKLKLEESQAAAAAGQIHLVHAYEEALRPHNITIAQILLTLTDSEERRRYLNARSTLEILLGVHAVPIVNENDTVATSEIRYGDNDRLAARVAQMISADCLVLLSDIDGLYNKDPTKYKDAVLVPEVKEITPDIEAMAETVSPRDAMGLGSGGMVTKLMAARICLNAGCHLVIGNGHTFHPLKAIEQGASCTWFVPSATPLAARKQWIVGALDPKGTIRVDAGAVQALRQGKSLLPAGIIDVKGHFERGDAVIVQGPSDQEIARGLTAYSQQDAAKIMGHKSREIERLLGYRGRTAMIHVDDLVITGRDVDGASETGQ